MYETFYGLREKPFSLLPDPSYLYLSKQHQMALTVLEYSLENQAGFCVITGSIGTGKTTLIRRLLSQTGKDISIGLISNTHHAYGELMRWIMVSFGLETAEESRPKLYKLFTDYLISQYAKNKRTMIIIDEAQNMSVSALEELRMLSNINSEKDLLLQIMLVGQPGLREILSRPDLEQFAQRVTVDYNLVALSHRETHEYIRHRLKTAGGEESIFSDDACDAVYRHSGGTPRLINLLCDLALVYGYAGQCAVITQEVVEQVIRERQASGALQVFDKTAALKPPRLPEAMSSTEKKPAQNLKIDAFKSEANSAPKSIDKIKFEDTSMSKIDSSHHSERTMPDIRAYEMALANKKTAQTMSKHEQPSTVDTALTKSNPSAEKLAQTEVAAVSEVSEFENIIAAPPSPPVLDNVSMAAATLAPKTESTTRPVTTKGIKVDWAAIQPSRNSHSGVKRYLPYGIAAALILVLISGVTFFLSTSSKNALAKSAPLAEGKVTTPMPVTTLELSSPTKAPTSSKLEQPSSSPADKHVTTKKDPLDELRKKIIENQHNTVPATTQPLSANTHLDSRNELRLKILEIQQQAALTAAQTDVPVSAATKQMDKAEIILEQQADGTVTVKPNDKSSSASSAVRTQP